MVARSMDHGGKSCMAFQGIPAKETPWTSALFHHLQIRWGLSNDCPKSAHFIQKARVKIIGALIAAGVIAAAGAVGGGIMASNAAKDAASALSNPNMLNLSRIPAPETVDWKDLLRQTPQLNLNNLDNIFALGNRVNQFQTNQFLRGANKIQPYFSQLQDQIGRNALSFSKGELPGDVVGSIGRAAASRGFASGIAGGARGGGYNTALGNLNLRNLGLTSLDLSKFGTGVAMQANQNAAGMVPNLFDPTSQMVTPGMAIQSQFQNVGIANRWNELNTAIQNAEATGNTDILNSALQAATGVRLQGQLNQAKSVQAASSALAGVGSQYASMGQGTGMVGTMPAKQQQQYLI